ncbi:MAG: CoA pyrophosphatase [Dehalococcoidia bacterium]|nr:CoA pyrophosphatase [Dehalococcoidia bacterium]
MKQQIKNILRHHKKKMIAGKNLKASAVLIPLFHNQGQYHILFTERSKEIGLHEGQVCFPGGTHELSDSNLLQTVLRETEEEISLKAEDVEILGELDDITTLTSNYVISPFVAFMLHPYSLNINNIEVERVFSVPLSFFMDKSNFKQDSYEYEYKGHIIWGATARILRQFIDLLTAEGGA